MKISRYTVRYAFHLDGAYKEMAATREGVSARHVLGMEAAEWSDLLDLPRISPVLTKDGRMLAQIGYYNEMHVVLSVEGAG